MNMAYRRGTWGARGTVPHDPNPKRALYVHHSAAPSHGVDTLAEQRAMMRRFEDEHMAKGWDTIGYSFVLFMPHGKLKEPRVYEGRGWSGQPAAQLGHNTGTIAVCVHGNFELEDIDRASLHRLVSIAKSAKRHGVVRMGGHRDAPGQSTACPGRRLEARITGIAREARLHRV